MAGYNTGWVALVLLTLTAFFPGCSPAGKHFVPAESRIASQSGKADYFFRNAQMHEERGDLQGAARNFCLALEAGSLRASRELKRLNATCNDGVAVIAMRPEPVPETLPSPSPGSDQQAAPIAKPKFELVGTGSGFSVADTAVVTNHHVIKECRAVTLRRGEDRFAATAFKADRRADLALLFTEDSVLPALPVRISDAELGEDIIAFGFPYSQFLSSTPKLSVGVVSATAGIGDNTSEYQISAPLQPGNSGGPVVGTDGTVVGVSVAMLNSSVVYEETGSLPQNVNFAVKGSVLRMFLDVYGVKYGTVPAGPQRDRRKIAATVTEALFVIECWA